MTLERCETIAGRGSFNVVLHSVECSPTACACGVSGYLCVVRTNETFSRTGIDRQAEGFGCILKTFVSSQILTHLQMQALCFFYRLGSTASVFWAKRRHGISEAIVSGLLSQCRAVLGHHDARTMRNY